MDTRPEMMVHPGPVLEKRVMRARGDLIHASTRDCVAGNTLADAVSNLVAQTGCTSGTGYFEGVFSRFSFTTGGPARDGKAANYTFIRTVDAASPQMRVRFTFGLDASGNCFVHAHGHFTTALETGEEGGHLFPAECVISSCKMMQISAMEGLLLRHGPDEETLHSVFEIEASASTGGAMFIRARPNVDLASVIIDSVRYAGGSTFDLLDSIGSINTPRFNGGAFRAEVGMEILSLSADGRSETIICTAIDANGHAHTGTIGRGDAPICVTAELLLRIVD